MKKALLISLLIFTFSFFAFHLTPPVLAQIDPITNPAIPEELGTGTPENIVALLIARLLAATLSLGAITFLVYLVWGAYKWLTSGGDKNALSQAQGHITHAVIGLILLASIFAVTNIIGPLLGLDFLSIAWPTFE